MDKDLAPRYQPGQKVMCNGYPGTVKEVYIAPERLEDGRVTSGMYNVRLARGTVCVPGSDLVLENSRSATT